jgi:hypothetical protein
MADSEKPKRPPGRPKGYPRSGGRKPGTPNKDRAATIERIMRAADPRGLVAVLFNMRQGGRNPTSAPIRRGFLPPPTSPVSAPWFRGRNDPRKAANAHHAGAEPRTGAFVCPTLAGRNFAGKMT